MVANALITADPNPAALAEACLRGCWIPLPLQPLEAFSLSHLVILSPGCRAIEAMGPIQSFRCSDPGDGQLLWLPLLQGRRRLRHPIALGAGPLLEPWLPRHGLQWQRLPVQELLVAESVQQLLSELQGLGRGGNGDPVPAA